MNFLQKRSLKAKLWLVPAIAVLMLGVVGVVGYFGLSRQDAALREIVELHQQRQTSARLYSESLRSLQGSAYRYLAWAASGYSQDAQAALLADVRRDMTLVTESSQRLATQPQLGGNEAELVRSIATQTGAIEKLVGSALDMGESDPLLGTTVMVKADVSFQKVSADMQKVQDTLSQASRQAYEQARAAHFSAVVSVALTAVIGLVVAAVATLLTQKSILGAVAVIQQAATQLRNGDLRHVPHVEGRDEVASSSRALAETVQVLREAMLRVRESSKQIDQTVGEIAQGNADLSSRTEQQAADLQRTSSNMADLVDAVTGNAQNSREAARLADESLQAAREGGVVVEQVMDVMQEITTSASRIRDITAVIDSIAFQTNILALNAAVEAARAGETGRGFAVVAGEVRTLSQRSAQAASEIKSLIGDSVERIESGAVLVGRAGSSMQRIVGSAERLASTVESISQASEQQHHSLSDISRAVQGIDLSTQQNAALVEQAAATGSALHEESRHLVEAVDRFRLEAHNA